MNAASLDKSPRLQRVAQVLKRGERSTMQIVRQAKVCAVNSIVSELRANGWSIVCRRRMVRGVLTWNYLATNWPRGAA